MSWSKYSKTFWNDYGSFGYDAAWAAALALHKTSEVLQARTNRTRRLENFTYDDMEMAQIILDALNTTAFEGVSVGFGLPLD